ncbi:hypothetical protein I553_1009 [Mycobacterium xenopi 4042]|uniref:Uncharacterized protein n=1 Tax=Mycobacterium xenopi 4042 TaxID=1299334 RepID=X7Z9I7_MYCXE|nr:hypothetical protein I553_1009 [Mycobacterium xenopi 4042]
MHRSRRGRECSNPLYDIGDLDKEIQNMPKSIPKAPSFSSTAFTGRNPCGVAYLTIAMQFKVPDFSCRKSIRFYHIEWNRQGDGVAVRYGDIQHMLVGGESFGRVAAFHASPMSK